MSFQNPWTLLLLPLASDIINRLYQACIFTKFNVRLQSILMISSSTPPWMSISQSLTKFYNVYLCTIFTYALRSVSSNKSKSNISDLLFLKVRLPWIPLKSALSLTGLPPATSAIYAGFLGSPISTVDSSQTSLNSSNLLTTSLRKTPLGHGDSHNG